jgi:hypothetical protein
MARDQGAHSISRRRLAQFLNLLGVGCSCAFPIQPAWLLPGHEVIE